MSKFSISVRDSYPGIRNERGEIPTEFVPIQPNKVGVWEIKSGGAIEFSIKPVDGAPGRLEITKALWTMNLALADEEGNEQRLFGPVGRIGSGFNVLIDYEQPKVIIQLDEGTWILKVLNCYRSAAYAMEAKELKIEVGD